jgi:hypothetical protein
VPRTSRSRRKGHQTIRVYRCGSRPKWAAFHCGRIFARGLTNKGLVRNAVGELISPTRTLSPIMEPLVARSGAIEELFKPASRGRKSTLCLEWPVNDLRQTMAKSIPAQFCESAVLVRNGTWQLFSGEKTKTMHARPKVREILIAKKMQRWCLIAQHPFQWIAVARLRGQGRITNDCSIGIGRSRRAAWSPRVFGVLADTNETAPNALNSIQGFSPHTLVRNYGDVIDSLCEAAAASAFVESLVNKALRSLRVKVH